MTQTLTSATIDATREAITEVLREAPVHCWVAYSFHGPRRTQQMVKLPDGRFAFAGYSLHLKDLTLTLDEVVTPLAAEGSMLLVADTADHATSQWANIYLLNRKGLDVVQDADTR